MNDERREPGGVVNKGPTVSVVMAVFNGAESLRNALDSVMAQTLSEWELIIIDDASEDETARIANDYAADARVRVLSHEVNQGAAKARNYGIAQSIGRYIAFLDADDSWSPEKLSKQVAFMKTGKWQVSCCGYRAVNIGSERSRSIVPPERIEYRELLSTTPVGFSTGMYDASTLGKRYFGQYRTREDFLFWLSFAREGIRIGGLREVLATYALDARFRRKAILARDMWRVYSQEESLSATQRLALFIRYAIQGVKKTY